MLLCWRAAIDRTVSSKGHGMADCDHVEIVRVVEIGGKTLRHPQNGVFSYYCKTCHLTLYVQFTSAPPIRAVYGNPES